MKQGGYKMVPKKDPTAFWLSGVLEAPLGTEMGPKGVRREPKRVRMVSKWVQVD